MTIVRVTIPTFKIEVTEEELKVLRRVTGSTSRTYLTKTDDGGPGLSKEQADAFRDFYHPICEMLGDEPT
jgi:hypothetical protein